MRLARLPLTLLLAVAVAAPLAARPLRLDYQGTGVATEIDINDDGVASVLVQASGKGSLGQIGVSALFDAVLVANTRCAPGEIENDLVFSSNVVQNSKGDQLFLTLVDGVLCADPTFTTFTLTLEEAILGGTGKFAGATGGTETTCAGVFLALDLTPAGGRAAHSAFSCEVSGDLD